jgi:hypothetical protein
MGKIWLKVPRPEPKRGKSLSIWNVFVQIIHLPLKSSEVVKKRLITESRPIQTAQRKARPRINTNGPENFFSLRRRSLKKRMIKLKDRRRLKIPILDAENIRPMIITIIEKAMRSVFPSNEERR